MTNELVVVRPGMLTTVQDLGRWGFQDRGVPVAGPMDVYSHRAANRMVGNPDDAAALEVTLIGPELEARGELVCAIAGARFTVTANGTPIDAALPFTLRSGARLRFGDRNAGARASLAVAGGFDVPPTFGSRATSLISRLGPFGGRALIAGDVLPIGHVRGAVVPRTVPPLRLPDGGARLHVMLGTHADRFTPETIELFTTSRYHVTPASNRMGYRLEGPVLRHRDSADILSDATPIGAIQVPASGQPILLMADRQTTGGYTKIAHVISADVPLAGQLAPGDWIEFVPCARVAALDALRRLEGHLTDRKS